MNSSSIMRMPKRSSVAAILRGEGLEVDVALGGIHILLTESK